MNTSIFPTEQINDLQRDIMTYVIEWIRTEKTIVPQKQIVIKMKADGVKELATVHALNMLIKKGYIARAYTMSNRTYYKQLRGI
jgi:hypothetical protein